MAYEPYNTIESGLGPLWCLRDAETGKCLRNELGHLYTYTDAAAALAAAPVVKPVEAPAGKGAK